MWSELETVIAQDLPFVCFRMPKSNTVNVYQQKNKSLNLFQNFKAEGFVFAPFETEKLPSIFLIKDNSFNFEYLIEEGQIATVPNFSEKDRTPYLNRIKKAVATIQKGSHQKIVLSRPIHVENQQEALALYKTCLDNYTNAFCYLFHHPSVGTWLGATPERLCKVQGNTLETTSLAGTMVAEGATLPKWGQKELAEQQMVTDYILSALEPFTEAISVSKVQTVKAGNLWHLKTNISAQLLTSQSLVQIVQALHPTPAVCGIPKTEAKAYILQNEGYDRTYYTGYLGPINLHKEQSEVFVNLRCMQLRENEVTIYVGGGLTKDSVAKKEWEETQAKSKTMGALLS